MESDDDSDVSLLLSSALEAFKSPILNNSSMSQLSETPESSSSRSSPAGESSALSHTFQPETPAPSIPMARSSSTDSVIDPSLRTVEQGYPLLTDIYSTGSASDVFQSSVAHTYEQVGRSSTGGKQPKSTFKRRLSYQDAGDNSSDDDSDRSESEETRLTYYQFANAQAIKYSLPDDLSEVARAFSQVRVS